MTKVYIIRHAEAEGNLYRRIHGHYDSRVTAQGLLQLERLRDRFMDIPLEAVYSSDLNRARLTAKYAALGSGLPVRTDPNLREVFMGDWEDKTWGDVIHSELEEYIKFSSYTYDWHIEGSENFAHAGQRMERMILDIAKRHPGGEAAVVSHGCAIRALICRLKGVTHDVFTVPHGDNTGVTLVRVEGDSIDIEYMYDASHLPDELSRFRRQKWRSDKFGLDSSALRFVPASDRAFDALSEDTAVGRVELDPEREAERGLGFISYYELLPEYRGQKLSAQLLGQAVSSYRKMGRHHLAVEPGSEELAAYFEHYGFEKNGGVLTMNIDVDQA